MKGIADAYSRCEVERLLGVAVGVTRLYVLENNKPLAARPIIGKVMKHCPFLAPNAAQPTTGPGNNSESSIMYIKVLYMEIPKKLKHCPSTTNVD